MYKRSHHQRCVGNELEDAFKLENLKIGKRFYDSLFSFELADETFTERKRLLARELSGMSFLSPGDVKLEELKGRISGDMSWRLERGELGNERE